MINCSDVMNNLGYEAYSLASGVVVINTPFSLVFDGLVTTLYISETKSGGLRITDDGNTLFEADSHGIKIEKSEYRDSLAALSGVKINDSEEFYVECLKSDLQVNLANMILAIDRVAVACLALKPS